MTAVSIVLREDFMARTPERPDPSQASGKYSGTGQGEDRRREERREKGVYGADAEKGPGYEREDKAEGGRYGVERTVERTAEDEGSSEAGTPAAKRPGRKA